MQAIPAASERGAAHFGRRLVARHGIGEGAAHGGLRRQDARHPACNTHILQLAKTFGDAEQELAIAGGQHHGAGNLAAELGVELVRQGLVAFRPERIAGMKAGEIACRDETGFLDDAPQRRPPLLTRNEEEGAPQCRLEVLRRRPARRGWRSPRTAGPPGWHRQPRKRRGCRSRRLQSRARRSPARR